MHLERLLVGGHSNPLEVIEQITYLLFLKRLDELQTVEEIKANTFGMPMERRVFPEAPTRKGAPMQISLVAVQEFRAAPKCSRGRRHVFPFLRTLGGDGSTYAHHMKDARFTFRARRFSPRPWT